MSKYKNIISKISLWVIAIISLTSSVTLADDYMYVKATHLNVRTAWNHKAKIMAVIDSWYKVVILESLSNKWKKVLLEDWRIGYVNWGYLTTSEPYYEKVTASRYTIKFWKAFVRWLNLIKKEAVLENWDILEVTSDKIYLNNWIQVRIIESKVPRYAWRVGYIGKKLVKPIEWYIYVNNTPEYNNQENNTNYVNENYIPMNSAPSEPVVNTDNSLTIDEQPSLQVEGSSNWFQWPVNTFDNNWFWDNASSNSSDSETPSPIIDDTSKVLPMDDPSINTDMSMPVPSEKTENTSDSSWTNMDSEISDLLNGL